MDLTKEHFCYVLIYYFLNGRVSKKLRDVYGYKLLKETQCQGWLVKFRLGEFSLKDKPR